MAYKFQSGLARLGGTVSLDSRLEVSGALDLTDQSIAVADLDLGGATSYNLAGGSDGALSHTDELVIMDDSDSDNGKVMTLAQMATYMSGSDPSFLQVNQATQAASGSFRVVGHSISGSSALEVVGASFLQGAVTLSGALGGGTTISGSGVISGLSLDVEKGADLNAGGITNAGAIAGATTIDASGDLTVGTITNAEFTVDADGNTDIDGTLNVEGVPTFQAGAVFSGGITTAGAIAGASTISGSGAISGHALDIETTANVAGVLTAGGLTVGSAVMSEADLEKLDDITNGTVAASKAVVVDANKDFSGFRNMSGSGELQLVGAATIQGNITTSGSLVIGAASMSEADLEQIDGLTAGTAVASKALVVDSNKDIGTLRHVTSNGTVTGASASFGAGGFTTLAASGVATVGGLTVGSAVMSEADLEKLDGITNGTGAAAKALVLDASRNIANINNLSITGDLEVQGTINKVTTNTSELEIEDKRILVGSGSNAANLDGGGVFFGGGIAGDAPTAPHIADISFNDAAEDELIFNFSGSEAMKIDAGGDLATQGTVTAVGSFIIGSADMSEADLEKLDGITNGTVAAAKAIVVDGNKDFSGFRNMSGSGELQLVGAATIQGNITTSGSLVIGGASMSETDLEKLDGITNGTVAAAKAVVVDADKDASGFRNVTGTGAITAGTSFIIGSADMNEADLEKLDGITAGTAAAGKAMVLDALGDIAGGRNLNITGMLLAQTMVSGAALNINDSAFTVDDDGAIAVATNKFTVSAAGAVGAAGNITTQAALQVGSTATISELLTAGTVQSTGSFQLGYSTQAYVQHGAGTANNNDQAGVLALVSASADGYGAEFFTGPLLGEGAVFSGTIPASGYPSFISVIMTGSEAVYLKLPDGNLGAGDAGKVLTIKKQSLHEGPLVLTGSGGVAGLFDGTLQALTMSSPMAAVNLVWNGSGYNLY